MKFYVEMNHINHFLDKGYKSGLYTNKWVYTANDYARALIL
jgi:hypothetical protein